MGYLPGFLPLPAASAPPWELTFPNDIKLSLAFRIRFVCGPALSVDDADGSMALRLERVILPFLAAESLISVVFLLGKADG